MRTSSKMSAIRGPESHLIAVNIDTPDSGPYALPDCTAQGAVCMADGRVERRLSAIFAGDIAGYSWLMGADEEGTLARSTRTAANFLTPTSPNIADESSNV